MKIHDFKRKKQESSKICMVTCYDYPSACTVAQSSVDCVLVGDSVAMAVHGYENTLMATMDMMVLHTQAVARGLSQQFLITDLPFLSHKLSRKDTLCHVQQLFRAGAQAVKIEGADVDSCETIKYLVDAGIPVMGHIGLTAQHLHQLGGYRIQGRNKEQGELLLQQAIDLEQSGCFALVVECVPKPLAKIITEALTIPTIGIGAGSDVDGQVLVWHDLLGLQTSFNPKFLKKFAQGYEVFLEALNAYANHVQKGTFPALEHSF